MARSGQAWRGKASYGRLGWARRDMARCGLVWQELNSRIYEPITNSINSNRRIDTVWILYSVSR